MKEKKKKGRPSKYNKKVHPIVGAWLARHGYTDKEIAESFDISEKTLNEWKKKDPDFRKSLKKNKEVTDSQVENSLLKRAMGYEYIEIQEEEVVLKRKGKRGQQLELPAIKRKTTTKQVIPDTIAQIFWLKNRQPDKWRDRVQHEHGGINGGKIEVKISNDFIPDTNNAG